MNKTIFLTITILLSLTYWQATAQFTESFDNNIPTEWTVIDNDGQGTTWQFHAGNGYRGDGGLWIYQEDFAHDDYLISPQFTVTSGLTDHISFYAGGSGVNFRESFEVKVSTTGTNPSDFDTLLGSESTISNVDTQGEYVNYAYNLAAFDGETVYVAIVATSTRSFRLYLDEFTADALPSCPKPSSINIQNLTDSSVDVNWNLGGTEDEWNVKYGPQGFNPETQGDLIAVMGTPNTFINNLEGASSYDVYIEAVCGGQGESEMAGPFTFKTLCTPATLPFFEGFEENYINDSNLGNCWSQEIISNTHWKVNNSLTAGNRGPRTGDWNIYLTKGSETWMFYPIEVQSGISYSLSLHARQSNTAGADIAASYGASESSSDMIHEIIPTTEITNGDYQEVSGSFIAATSGIIYIGIRGHLIGGYFPFYLSVDDISITESQSCFKPTELQIEEATPTTATISWTPGSAESDWIIKYGEPGFDPLSQGLSLQVNSNPNGTITDLIPAHIYSVFVQSLCGGADGNSFFAGPITLKTTPINDDLCNATALVVDGLCTGNMYTNVGATLQRDEPQGSCYDAAGSQTVWFSFEAPGSGNVTVTTDFEGGTLEDTEVAVFESAIDCNNLISLGVEVGCDEDGGVIGDGFLSVVTLTNLIGGNTYYIQVNGFESFGEGTFEGTFCIEVQNDGVDCPKPTNVTINDITPATAYISWTAGSTETEWEILYGPVGFDPNTTGISIIDNDGNLGETLSGLSPNTSYDVYVRALCNRDDVSDFSEIATFSTLIPPPINDDVCGAISLIVDAVCTGNTYTNVGATMERDETQGSCLTNFPYTSVWFTFVAPPSGNVTVTTNITPSDLENTQMTVYENTADCAIFSAMGTEVGCNDDVDLGNNQLLSTVILTNLNVGAIFYVQINGSSSAEGDFCIEVRDDGIICNTPSNISVSDVTDTTASVNWIAGGNETEWEIKYGTVGFDPLSTGESVLDNDGIPNEILTNLQVDTAYDVYVRAICDTNTESDFEGPQTFTTEALSVGHSNFISFNYYPNPVKNELTLTANSPMENVVIYNLLGQKQTEVKVKAQTLQLNTTSMQQGVYFVKVTINGENKIFRIIKE